MRENKVLVGIFPELTMTEELTDLIRETLKGFFRSARGNSYPRLIVPGSFHAPVSNKRVMNICSLISANGENLYELTDRENSGRAWKHNKMTPYEWDHGTKREALSDSARILGICDFWFARTTAMICLDYLLEEVQRTAKHLEVGLFLVPAMTSVTDKFEAEIRKNVQWPGHPMTIIANTVRQLKLATDTFSLIGVPIHGKENTIRRIPLEANCKWNICSIHDLQMTE
jgi:hypothetical protein